VALNNFIGKRKWKSQFDAGLEAFSAEDFVSAEASLSTALEHASGISERDSSFGDTALMLGQVFRRTDRYDQADEMAKKAFDSYKTIFGVTDPRTIKAHLAIVLSRPERCHVNLDVRKATFEATRLEFGESSWQAVRTAALALESFSKQERALILDEVREACTGVLGNNRLSLPTWPPVAEEFSDALVKAGEIDDGLRFLSLQLRMNDEVHGKKSIESAKVRLKMGELFIQIGKPDKAEISFSRAMDCLRLKLGPKSEEVQRATIALARALTRQKKLAEAEPYLTEALLTLSADRAEERIEVLLGLLEYKCLVAGTDSERGALWQELESFWDRAEDEAVRTSIFSGLLEAQRRLQQGWELQAADRFLHAVLARVRQWVGATHPHVAHVLMELCSCAVGADDKARAETFMEQSLALNEDADNLIRAARNQSRLGEWERARQTAAQAIRLIRIEPTGPVTGRREAQLADVLLRCGEMQQALTFAEKAHTQLPVSERFISLVTRARVKVMEGVWDEADRFFGQALDVVADPYECAQAHLQRAWMYVQSGDFALAKNSLEGTRVLTELRGDHPVVFQVKAVTAQMAFYQGNVYEGREIRESVFNFLSNGGHKHAPRSLDILSLLEPFMPDEADTELTLGERILALSDFPERFQYAFPSKDVAGRGLRHIVRALQFQGKLTQARERLEQYKVRYFSHQVESNPRAGMFHLTAAQVAETEEERVASLELAVKGLSALSPRHVALFSSLNRLAKSYMGLGNAEMALDACRRALDIRQNSKVQQWVEMLERGEFPVAASPKPESVVEESVDPSADESVELPSEESVELPSEESVEPSDELDPSDQRVPSFEIDVSRPGAVESEPVMGAIAATGTRDVSLIPLARELVGREEEPTEEEVELLLSEVKARFGDDRPSHTEARVMLALLFEDGSDLAEELWLEAMELISEEDDLKTLENRARDARAGLLVLLTIEELLRRETERHGDNSVDTVDTQMKLARALDDLGRPYDAYRRLTMVAEILRSWFGKRTRRLLEPLTELMRIAENLNDTQSAFEHQLERHRILENNEAEAEDLFYSRVSLLPLRARLGQISELLSDVKECQQELVGFRRETITEFSRTLLIAARRVDQLHWRADAASELLEAALQLVPSEEVKLGCALRVALSDSLHRKDYKSQATRVRGEAIDMAGTLEADDRAEMYHLAAQSCVRLGEVEISRALAHKILEERIPEEGRKDIWAGRALLILAEADLLTYRLEGTETDIGMSAASLKGTRFWGRALSLKLQALFFLGRYEEAFELLKHIPEERALQLELKLAVWRGQGGKYVDALTSEKPTPLAELWASLELLPLEQAVTILEFLARAGQIALLAKGLTRIWKRITGILPTDARHARLQLLGANMQFWELDYEGAASTLLRALELFPVNAIVFPEGLVSSVARDVLLTCYLMEGRATSALSQAKENASEVAETMGEEDVRAITARVKLADCARALGSQDDALVLLDEILTPLQDHLGETHATLREVYHGLARTFLDQGDLDSARLSAEEALRIDKECRGLSIHFVQDLELLADIERWEDIPEAINLLDTAVELAEQVLPADHSYASALMEKREEVERLDEPPTPSADTLSPDDEDQEEAEVEDEPEESEEELSEIEAEQEVEEPSEETADSAEGLFVIDSEEFEESDSEEVTEVDSADELFGVVDESPQLQVKDEPSETVEELSEGNVSLEQLFAIEEVSTTEVAELEAEDRSEVEEEVAELETEDSSEDEEEVAELEAEDSSEVEEEVAELETEDSSEDEEEVAELEAEEEVAELEAEDSSEDEEEVAEVEAEDSSEDEEEVAEVEAEDSSEDEEEVAEVEAEDSSEDEEEVAELETEDSSEDEEEVAEVEAEDSSEDEEEVAEQEAEDSSEDKEEVAELETEESSEDEEEVAEVEAEDSSEVEEEVAEQEAEDSSEDEEEVAELEAVESSEDEEELAEQEAEDSSEDEEEVAELEAEESSEDEEEVAEQEAEDSSEDEEEVAELEAEDSSEDEEEVAELEAEESSEDEEEVAEQEAEDSSEDEEEVAELEAEDSSEEEEEVAELEAEEDAEDEDVIAELEAEDNTPSSIERSDKPYRFASREHRGSAASASPSVEYDYDFPEVPLRLPHIDDLGESDHEEPEIDAKQEIEIEYDGSEESVESTEFSIDQILEIQDPESFLMPLAPVFFLPVPWKEATESAFDNKFDELYARFQKAFKKDGNWREVVEEAVSLVRRDPCHESGYFLFLLGAQLEKSGNLHTADVCLATAIELLDTGASYGAACHQAGRVAGRRGELKRALEYFERSAELAGEAEFAVLKIDAAECHLGMGRPEEALLGFEEVFDYLAENVPKVQALAIQAKMAQIHLLIGDPDTSLVLAEDTRQALSPKNVGTYRVLGRILLSRAYARLGRHQLALELAEKAWEGAEPWSAKRKDGRRIAICNLVDIYGVLGEFEKAQELIWKTGLTGYGLAEAEVLLRAGHISCALGDLPKARRYMRLGKSFLTRFRSPALWRSCFLELEAEIELKNGDFRKANEASSRALEVFEREATGPVDRSRHIVRWAKVSAGLGDLEKASDLMEQAHSLRDLHLGAEHPHTSSVEGLSAVLSGSTT
jgi:tetratricopeptide repeat protein